MSKLPIVLALVAAVGCSKKEATDKVADKPADKPAMQPLPMPLKVDPPREQKDVPTPAPVRPVKDQQPIAKPTGAADIKLGALPVGWSREDEGDTVKLEYVAAVNSTDFPVDNAMFVFHLSKVTGINAVPKDPAGYGEFHSLEMKTKVTRTEKLGDAVYYEFFSAKPEDAYWTVVTGSNGALISCGGSLYRDKDYNKIPKVRAEVINAAKKICATAKL